MLQKRGKILLLGDSITQMSFSAQLSGWGTHIADLYQRRADVYNRGFSGYNTDWFLKHMESDVGANDLFLGTRKSSTEDENGGEGNTTDDVKLVTVFFGANDASDSILNPRHHVPIPRFQSNLHKIIKYCQTYYGKNVRILLITPPPVHHESRLAFQIEKFGVDGATGKLERTLELSGEYAKAVERVARETGLPCLNLWKEMQNEDNFKSLIDAAKEEKEQEQGWKIFLSDGLHLSKEGNLFVGRRVIETIAESHPDIAITPCPKTGQFGSSGSKGGLDLGDGGASYAGGISPWHDQIEYKDADKAFQMSHKKRKM